MLKIWKNTIIQLINLKICSNRRERNDKIMKKATLYLLMISLIGMLEVPVHAADVYADESTELYSFDEEQCAMMISQRRSSRRER